MTGGQVGRSGAGAGRPAGLFVIDDRQRIVEWSDAAAAMTGLSAGQVLGRPCYDVLQGREPSGRLLCRRGCPLVRALEEGRLSASGVLVTGALSGQDAVLRCELLALPRQPGGALGRLHDCGPGAVRGDARRRSGAARDVVRDLCALATLATSLPTTPDKLGPSLESTLDALREATGAESAELFLPDPDHREVVLAAYRGPFRSAFFEILRFPSGEGFPGLVLERRAPVVTRALDRDHRYLRRQVKERGFRAYVCAPLIGPLGLAGVLDLASRRDDFDTDGGLRVLMWVGSVVGAALQAAYARLRDSLSDGVPREADDEEADAERLLRRALGLAVELGDADGGGLVLIDRQAGGAVDLVTAGVFPNVVCPALHPGAAGGVPGRDRPAGLPCPVVAGGRGLSLSGPRRSWPLPCRRAPGGGGARSCLPVLVGREAVGVVQLVHRRVPSPPTRSLALPLGAVEGVARLLERVWAGIEQQRRAGTEFRPEPAAAADQAPEAVLPPVAGPRPGTEPDLAIRCLGPFELRRRGLLVTPDLFRRRKALTLLKILLVHAGRSVPADTLVEWLWPGIDPAAGAGRLQVIVHALRRVLEPEGSGQRWAFVRRDADGYSFDPRAGCRLDVEEFRASIALAQRAERSGALDVAARAYEDAAELYRGDLLQDEPGGQWCWMEREHLREVFLGALKRLAALRVRAGELERAIELYRRALRADALREELHQRLIECLWRAGRRDEALRQYGVCRELLRRELDVDPLPETQRLAERVRGPLPA